MTGLKKSFSFVPILLLCHLCHTFVNSVSFEEDVRITYQQKAAIQKLRNRILPHIEEKFMEDDIYLVKWLRLTNFDIRRAERKLLENIKWRRDNHIATIEKDNDWSDVEADFPYFEDGYDKAGRPVLIAFAGHWNIRDAIITGRINRVLRYLDRGMEMLSRRIRKLQAEGKNVTQANLVVDLSDFSVVTHACVQCLVRIVDFLNSYENHFPGMAHRVYFLNAPPAVHFVIEMIRQNVSKESRDAIRVYGTNKEQWKKVLLEHIAKKYLPVELGGTLEIN